jgi:N-acetylmuramoyl-L-alanine amidase
MVKFFFILLFSISLFGASSNKELLSRADNFAKSSKTSNLFKAYNDYKTLYLNAVTKCDDNLKQKALNGIFKTGTALHIDVKEYESEQKGFDRKIATPQSKVVLTSMLKMDSAKWDDDTLILSFDDDINAQQVKYFTIHDIKHNRYRYVFDISSASLVKSHLLFKNGIDRINMNQFNPKTIRLVLENKEKIDLEYNLEGNELKVVLSTDKQPIKELFKSSSSKVQAKVESKDDEKNGSEELPQDLRKYSKSNKQKIIVIDPGHGGKDSGAIGFKNYYEKNVVLDVAQNVKNILISRGYKVFMTRDDDTFIELKERTAMANRKNADLFISIHANAVSSQNVETASGIETYFLSPSRSNRATKVAAMENSMDISEMSGYGKSTFLKFTTNITRIASNKLAIDVQKGILTNLRSSYKGVNDAGVREGPFWVLVGAQMPAILVEIGFITHPQEAEMLVDKGYEKSMAYGIANGVERYFINN